ncbi:hypothetical protein ACFFRR_010686 [Megaselia abdita]
MKFLKFLLLNWDDKEAKENIINPRLLMLNNLYIKFFDYGSFLIYFLCTFVLTLSIYTLYKERKRKRELLQRRRELLRAREKPPQKRRTGALLRDHEMVYNIFKHINEVVDEPKPSTGSINFRETESGKIYGVYQDQDQNQDEDNS